MKKLKQGSMNVIIVLNIGLFALGGSLIIANGSVSGMVGNRNTESGQEMFYSAESAMREGVLQYVNSLAAYAGGPFPVINDADFGTIVIETLDWPYIKVKGESENPNTYRNVASLVTLFPEGFAFDHAVYANHNLLLGGSAHIIGSIFANIDVDFNGNPPVDGDIYAAGDINNPSNNINGELYEGVDPVPPPQIMLDEYEAYAIASSTYFSTTTDAENYAGGTPANNVVIFIDDDPAETTRLQNVNLLGSIATRGNLRLTSGGTYTSFGDFAAIVVYGDLHLSGGVVINGIVYVKGDTTFGGGGATINGSILSVGGVDTTVVTGNVTINYVPSDWQNLEGLSTTTTATPQVLSWVEE